jgi:hypothetical protein
MPSSYKLEFTSHLPDNQYAYVSFNIDQDGQCEGKRNQSDTFKGVSHTFLNYSHKSWKNSQMTHIKSYKTHVSGCEIWCHSKCTGSYSLVLV